MSFRNLSKLCAIILLSAALSACSDDSPSNTPPDTSGQPDASGDDSVSPKDGEDSDTDSIGDACIVDEDCTAGANQFSACDDETNTCISACEDGFEDCDADPTNGCEAELGVDINNCGTCGTVCDSTSLNLEPICVEQSGTFICDVNTDQCAEGFVDLDGNSGCECEITDADDPVDGADSNCDGVDGVLEDSVFVSTDGSIDTTYDGLSPELPLDSIAYALQVAADNGRSQILVASGDYEGSITLPNGISIYGGFDTADGYAAPNNTNATRILASPDDFETDTRTYITVDAQAIDQPTILSNLTLVGFDAQNPGASTIALRALDASGLAITNTHIIGAIAAEGDPGTPGVPASCDASETAGGAGGSVSDVNPCENASSTAPGGQHGALSDSNAGTGIGGLGGEHMCSTFESATSGKQGAIGTPGQDGHTGLFPPEGALGSFDITGIWTPAIGTPPTDGNNGGGGGGGGAGGNHNSTLSSLQPGGEGGKGGNGGCAGGAATNGMPGGSSFGAVVIGEPITFSETTIDLGTGGKGGAGKKGADSGAPTNGDQGVVGGGSAGNGGFGGNGGEGGDGGNGVGGQGGNAIGLASFNATLDTSAITFELSNGAKGSGGDATLPTEKGREGVITKTHDFGSTN